MKKLLTNFIVVYEKYPSAIDGVVLTEEALSFYLAMFIALVLVTFIPALSLALPNLLGL